MNHFNNEEKAEGLRKKRKLRNKRYFLYLFVCSVIFVFFVIPLLFLYPSAQQIECGIDCQCANEHPVSRKEKFTRGRLHFIGQRKIDQSDRFFGAPAARAG